MTETDLLERSIAAQLVVRATDGPMITSNCARSSWSRSGSAAEPSGGRAATALGARGIDTSGMDAATVRQPRPLPDQEEVGGT